MSMRRWRGVGLPLALAALMAVVVTWLLWSWPSLLVQAKRLSWPLLGSLMLLYLGAHGVRMLRLALLCLDERRHAAALMAAHGLTGFLSSFVPFKGGEILRLATFFQVFDRPPKALAVWLAERFSDAVVLSSLIVGLHLMRVPLPAEMRLMLVFFAVACAVALLALFAVSKVLVYLNRHLVLSSHSRRGLWILRASAVLRMVELEIYRSVEGRLAGLFLLTVLVWAVEFWALMLLAVHMDAAQADAMAMFAASLTAKLPGSQAPVAGFGLYQSLALAVLTVLTVLAVVCMGGKWRAARGAEKGMQ